ncbi:MAG TPA: hypothetical protein ENK41_00160, partial [Rhodobacteraceae bacterium]|nr:hypothetical protein [Paracoccaceae bacterium]
MSHGPWFDEFRREIASDHRELCEARRRRAGSSGWSFDHALKRTRVFYSDRFTGYARCGSITAEDLARLMRMVETLGTAD